MLTKFEQIYNEKVESEPLKEYIELKRENPDSIIMFQIGKFFETFFEDAKIFSDITASALESRTFKSKIEIIESGIPKENLNGHIKKLLNNGLKVCVCSEYKDEYGIFHREITRKFTPGTIIEDEFLERNENNYIMSIYNNDDFYDIAYADVSTGQLYKTRCAKKNYRVEIDKIYPKEILISNKQEKTFKTLFSKFNITLLDDRYFTGLIEEVIDIYCKLTQKKYKIKLGKIAEYQCSSYMELDEITRKNLELTRTNYLMKKKGSILWFLNYTKTPMGMRLLKKFLSEPLLSKDLITERQNAVEELINNPALLDKTQSILEQFSDISRMCSRMSNATVMPKDLINFSRNTILIDELKQLINTLNSKLFKIRISQLNRVHNLASTIDKAIRKDCTNDVKSGNIINEGYNSELDFLRNELENLTQKVQKYEQIQRKKLDIQTLKIDYLPSIGYYIEIPSKYCTKLSNEYFKKNSTTKVSRYTTNELNELQENISSLKFKINELEYDTFRKIRLIASDFVEAVRALSHDIALIDVIASFAKCALLNKLIKPEISGNDVIIKEGYHPSLNKLNNEIVKNDTILKSGTMMILTGANMSGKSTYLKYNAIICLLAQIGSFVPASCAKLPIIDKIFFRQSSNDDIVNNNSSFMVEMNDLKYILENTTDLSLILLDEPAKSTNAKESGAIARAYCEYLLKNFQTKTIVATHNINLTKLENSYPSRALNFVMGSCNNNSFTDRKIRRGIVNDDYAIETAMLAQLPDEILELAKKYS